MAFLGGKGFKKPGFNLLLVHVSLMDLLSLFL